MASFPAAIASSPAGSSSFGKGMFPRAYGNGLSGLTSVYDVLGTIAADYDAVQENTVMSVNDTPYPVSVVTAPVGTLYGCSSANDGSMQNDSGGAAEWHGIICLQGMTVGGGVDTHVGVQTDESGSWAEIQTDIGSWRTSVYLQGRWFTWVCVYNLLISDGKKVRPICQNDANAPETLGLTSFSHRVWSRNAG